MPVEFAPAYERVRLSPISWPAVFGALVVGISVMLLLTLAGVAVGVTVIDPAADSPRAITVGAAVWQTVSMLIAALVGGYVAARLSGLRRTGDGVLHGAVAWGATTVLYALLALTLMGTLTAQLFGVQPAQPARTDGAPLSLLERQHAERTLESTGLTAEQARLVVTRIASPEPTGPGPGPEAQPAPPAPAAPTGVDPYPPQPAAPPQPQFDPPPAPPQPQFGQPPGPPQPQFGQPSAAPQPPTGQPPFGRITADRMETLAAATAWLAGAVLLALLFSMGGGAIGVRGARRTSHRRVEENRSLVSEPPSRVVPRPTA